MTKLLTLRRDSLLYGAECPDDIWSPTASTLLETRWLFIHNLSSNINSFHFSR